MAGRRRERDRGGGRLRRAACCVPLGVAVARAYPAALRQISHVRSHILPKEEAERRLCVASAYVYPVQVQDMAPSCSPGMVGGYKARMRGDGVRRRSAVLGIRIPGDGGEETGGRRGGDGPGVEEARPPDLRFASGIMLSLVLTSMLGGTRGGRVAAVQYVSVSPGPRPRIHSGSGHQRGRRSKHPIYRRVLPTAAFECPCVLCYSAFLFRRRDDEMSWAREGRQPVRVEPPYIM